MNIHEYQAKQLLAAFGVPVLAGNAAFSVDEAEKAATDLGGDRWVVKAQIHAGGRGKAGGVKLVETIAEVREVARNLLGRSLVTHQTGPEGAVVRRLYVEAAAGSINSEFYVSLLVDRASAMPTFVVSREGGVDIEEVAANTPEKITTISVDPASGYCPFHGRAIAQSLGLTGALAKSASALGKSLYTAFISKDLAMLEVNPLAIINDNELICLDAKISFDSNALGRHPEVSELRDLSEEDARETEAEKYGLNYIALEGEIGCMVNGAGLAMATMDIIKLYGKQPANFLDVGGGATEENVAAAFKIITSDKSVKAILVNIFGGIMRCDIIAKGILNAVGSTGLNIPLVVRLAGTNAELGKRILDESGLNIVAATDLDEAARKVVELT